jgi:hypothetical protein
VVSVQDGALYRVRPWICLRDQLQAARASSGGARVQALLLPTKGQLPRCAGDGQRIAAAERQMQNTSPNAALAS